MSGVIDESGQQWEHCNGCTNWVRIQDLEYEQPTPRFEYGRDLCLHCMLLSMLEPGCTIQPDPAAVAERAEAKRKYDESMRGKEYVFVQLDENTWQGHIIDVN